VTIDVDSREVTVDDTAINLARKEFELLLLLMENAGRVLTRSAIIERVWGYDYVGDTKTLDVHVKRVRAKIERDPSRPERIVTIRGVGYRYTLPRS
jgi:two-component system response regulator RegX3